MPTVQQEDIESEESQYSGTIIQTDGATIAQLMTQKGLEGGITLDGEFATDGSIVGLLHGKDSPKYSIGDLLARGGMGLILNAKDMNCRRNVAMKIITDGNKASNDQILRFIVEAQVTAQLEHPSIVPVYELSVDQNDDVFYTMKLVKGHTLVEILTEIRMENDEFLEKYSLMRLLNILMKVCEALAYAHSKGVIHRDLKPENIMIGDYGEVLLMDWGLAKFINVGEFKQDSKEDENSSEINESVFENDYDDEDEEEDEDIESILSDSQFVESFKTLDGQIMGTPGFMSPEQALGQIAEVDFKSDVYALGGILYNILALQPPITGKYIQKMIRQIVKGDIKTPSSYNEDNIFLHCPDDKIPEPLSKISMKAMDINPAKRYQSVEEMQEDIEKYMRGFATSVEDTSLFNLLVLLIKRHKREFIWLSVSTLILISVVTGFMLKIIEAKNMAETNLVMFLSEKGTRQEFGEKLISTVIQSMGHLNPEEKTIDYHYQQSDKGISLYLQNNTHLKDIRPLKELPLHKLNLNRTDIQDIDQLKGLPLEWLSIAETDISNISSLEDKILTLKSLNISGTKVNNLSSLERLKLVYLDISNTQVTDLAPISKMKLQELNLWGTPLKKFHEIKDMPIKRLGIDSSQLLNIDFIVKLNLEHLSIHNAGNADVDIVRKLNISSLEIQGRRITNISPLAKMNLRKLVINSTKVKDISALRRTKIESLKISKTSIRDISPVKDMMLTELILEKCYFLRDITPVKECKNLRKLLIPPHIKDVGFLKKIPTLTVLANNKRDFEENQTPDEFMKKLAAKKKKKNK